MANSPTKLSAKKILSLMPKAIPYSAIRLTDPEQYEKVPYEDFYSEFNNLDITEDQRKELENLQEEMGYLKLAQSYRESKLYVMFILRLQAILYRGRK